MRNVAVLSHIADIDGVGAAALVKRRFGMPSSNIFFTSHGLGTLNEAERGLRRLYKKQTLLFITDMNPDEKTAPVYKKIIKSMKRSGGGVVLLDHHEWRETFIKEIAALCDVAVIGENKKMCATELVKKYLGLDDEFVRKFVDLVHHTDFFIKFENKRLAEMAEIYKLGIDYYDMNQNYDEKVKGLRHIADIISKGKLIDARVRLAAQKFERLNASRIEKMLKRLYFISDRIAIGFSRQVDSTDSCMSIIHKTKREISIVVNVDYNKGSIRSTDTGIVGFANELGGGGHPHAAGFNIPREYNLKTEKGRKLFVSRIAMAAKKTGVL